MVHKANACKLSAGLHANRIPHEATNYSMFFSFDFMELESEQYIAWNMMVNPRASSEIDVQQPIGEYRSDMA